MAGRSDAVADKAVEVWTRAGVARSQIETARLNVPASPDADAKAYSDYDTVLSANFSPAVRADGGTRANDLAWCGPNVPER